MAELSGNPKQGWWRRVTLRDAIVFTLPPMALALWLFGAAVMDYHRVRQFDDWWSSATSIRKFGWLRLRTALRSLEVTEVSKRLSAEREDKPLLRLLVNRSDWDRIDGDVGGHWGEWIPAQVLDGNDLLDVELRFRGDGSAHWTSAKKSFTVKTKRGDLLQGHRTLAFSVKEVLPQWYVATLAGEFGLHSPEQQLVPVYLNDRFYGMHRFIEPIDEAFLRRRELIPGNVFRADAAERGDYFKGLPREVFKNPYVWELAAESGRPDAPGRESLEQFLADLNGSTVEDHERFMARLDVDEISRLLAYLLVVGDPFHMSGVHNQFWYEDPSNGKFHPLPWDVRLLDLEHPPRGSNYNRFWRAALRDPRVWSGTMRVLADKLKDDRILREAEERIHREWSRYRDEFQYDTLRNGVIPPVGDPDSTLATLRKNVETLRGWMKDARASVGVARTAFDTIWVIDVVVEGRAPLALAGFNAEISGDAGNLIDEFRRDSNGNGALDPDDERLGHPNTWDTGTSMFPQPFELAAALGGTGDELTPIRRHERFFWVASLPQGVVDNVRLSLRNAIDGTAIQPTPLTTDNARLPTGLGLATRAVSESFRGIRLEGQASYERCDSTVFGELEVVTIAPGAEIVLEDEASLVFKGRVLAIGTAENPITIRGADERRPWGTIALQGPGASGSRFEHVKFIGGGARVGSVVYSGMVCIHDAQSVTFENCEFSGNVRCDDALHAASADVTVASSHFHDVNSDAIDFDRSSGTINGNVIERSPADAIELTGSSPRVVGNTIRDAGGRGIAIGQFASPLVFANTLERSATAIDVRDAAEPVVLQNAISGCERGIVAYRKNATYPVAGWPKLLANGFRSNGADWIFGKGGRRTLIGAADEELPTSDAVDWFLRSRGVRIDALRRGPPASFELVEPLAPLFEHGFAESFADVTNGWHSDGGASRVLQRGPDLHVALRDHRARVARAHDWDLSDASREYVLVLEVAGENVRSLRALASSPGGSVESDVALDDEPDTFTYAAIPLPARRYDGLMLTAEPASARSSITLHAYRIFAWPSRDER
jgi:hypothetical protein